MRIFPIVLGGVIGTGVFFVLRPARLVTPAFATEAQLRSEMRRFRTALSARTDLAGDEILPPVIFLPPRRKIGFIAPLRAVTWYSVGGRFSPGGVFTPPNTPVPYLVPAQEWGSGRARFAILCPPADGIAPVPNVVDMPPVLLSEGEDRHVVSRVLRQERGRFPLPDREGCGRLKILAEAGLVIRAGELAPLRLPLSALPFSGVLLGRTTLHRKAGPRSVLKGGLHPVDAFLFARGIRRPLFRPEIVWGRSLRYEMRTIVHLYQRERSDWRLTGSRVVTAVGNAHETEDAAALSAVMPSGPIPAWRSSEETFMASRRPGESLIPYVGMSYSIKFDTPAEWR